MRPGSTADNAAARAVLILSYVLPRKAALYLVRKAMGDQRFHEAVQLVAARKRFERNSL
jgi:hypothetical protein